jgi:hypothetical protein
MNSSNLTILNLTVSAIAVGLSLWSFLNYRTISRLRRIFFSGKNGRDLETAIEALVHELSSARAELLETQNSLARLYEAFGFAVQKVGLVRFNPFSNGGGNFSFTLALLDGHNNGVVVTSMHGREQNRIYTKKIQNGKTDNALTEEETQAILQANFGSSKF